MANLSIYDEQNDIDLENKIAAVTHEHAKIFHSVTIHSVSNRGDSICNRVEDFIKNDCNV